MEGKAVKQQLEIMKGKDSFHLCGDYEQEFQEKSKQVMDNLNDQQNMVCKILKKD